MKKIFVIFILTVFVCGIAVNVSEASVINDLVKVPSADVLVNKGEISGQINSGQIKLAGIYKIDPRVEIGGFIGQGRNNGFNNADIGLLVRASLLKEASNQPAIAAGIEGRDLYLVMSKGLGYGVRGHLGIGNGKMGGLFVGINKVVNPISVKISEEGVAEDETSQQNTSTTSMPTFNLMAEYIAGDINIGVRTTLENNIYLDLGLEELSEFRAGLSFVF